jgi:hypothetical protein
MEEYAEGWLAWANEQVGPRFGVAFTPIDFFFTAFLLIFYELAGAAIGWWAPAVSLAVPALFIVNAVFLHMLPSARSDRLTPGTLSAIFIYLPVAAAMFWAAAEDGYLNFGTIVLAFILGTALMYYPLGVAILAKKVGWQEGVAGDTDAVGEGGASSTDEPVRMPAAETTQTETEVLVEERAAEEVSVEERVREEPEIEVEGEPVEPATEVLDSDTTTGDGRP